jgi:predicted RNA binding protein YcfA (HicA-like mRNA interferase family)
MSVKVRDLVKALRAASAVPVRTNGSHQVWRTANGENVVVTINHMNKDACSQAVRAARRAGVEV